MLEPKHLSLVRRGLQRQGARKSLSHRNRVAGLEPLEARRLMTSAPVVAATQITSAATLHAGAIPDLIVNSTAGFTPTGDLFVQTSNGVATIQYAGLTATSFTGCSVVGDTYDVGAGDTSGTLSTTYRAVFQATHDTFGITVPNATNLPEDGQHNLYFSMSWSSVGGSNDNFFTLFQDSPGHYKFVNFADYSNGNDVPGAGTNSTLPTFDIAGSGATTTISLPYIPINSARIYFFLGPTGTTSPLTTQDGGSGHWSVVQPSSSNAAYIYDYLEVNLDANGTSAAGSANPSLSKMTIDTTQVDQFGIPMTLAGDSNDGRTSTSYTSGVTNSPNVARDRVLGEFASLHSAAGDPYGQLVVGPSGQSGGLDLRIVNPAHANITTASPLGYIFDAAIKQLFETGTNSLDLVSNADQRTYTATRTQISADDIHNVTHMYNVIRFTSGTNTFYIYEPFFSTNAPATASLSPVDYGTAPPPPSWINVNPDSTSETAGQMVFANDGVFADYAAQPGLSAGQQTVLGDLENQLVAALNRGVASLPSSQWQDSGNFYTTGVYNQYAQFLHDTSINGTPIMIGGDAYAFAYDDNGDNSTTLALQNQTGATVTFGPWMAAAPSGSDAAFLAAVYEDVLDRPIEAAGQSFWLNVLSNGASREQVSLWIVSSAESRADLIKAFYSNLLHRNADSQAVAYFLQLFDQGLTASDIKSMFYGSDEYFQLNGDTNSGFVDALFRDELSRAAGSQDQAYYGQLLAAGQSRTNIASLVADSAEAEHDQVNGYYLAYLGRPADAAGLAYWTSVLEQTHHDSLVQAGLLGSEEYYYYQRS